MSDNGLWKKDAESIRKPLEDGHRIALEKGISETAIIDFSSTSNPLGSPFDYPDCKLCLKDIFSRVESMYSHFPDNEYSELRSSAAKYFGNNISADNIVPALGVEDVIRMVFSSVIETGDTVLLNRSQNPANEKHCIISGGEVNYVFEDDLKNISSALLKKAKIILLTNPDNLFGQLYSKSDLISLLQRCNDHSTLLVVDESLIDFTAESVTMVGEVSHDTNLLVIRSLKDTFSLPGAGIAFGITNENFAAILNRVRNLFNLGLLEEATALSLLDMQEELINTYLPASRQFVRENRRYLMERLSKVRKFKTYESNTSFVLVDVSAASLDSVELTRRLAEKGLLVRDCSDFYSLDRNFIRVSVRPKEDTDRLVEAIGTVVVDSARDSAMENLNQILEEEPVRPLGANRACPYYPCHFKGQDCTFCFCPFYPCGDECTGGRWVCRSSGGKVWSCEKCGLVHQKPTVRNLLDVLKGEGEMEDKLKKAWDEVMEPLL
ncbi:aminotransferase class I/II-fold pyridoxal phosphate-dependent enzyme [Methanohalophilus sp. RSK]|uniref:aminotransferase class I/II-fold pyridoxal phosphate-dependent enzyme n=1 Tax=Methanohalophilus sp. RSK TaxID=2485783 RepID=UPI000F43922A|nr:aminotransferase class I/II-fold pyridoxal phosphate-dependent enzyme [Methanohalophilus sp. RSK]RNI13696.1 aminotransferase class I/II-fold pyridoxal phosphate-dependent enzyme [Methanohalophilus sp. RSK]